MRSTAAPRPTVSNLIAGKVVQAGYIRCGKKSLDAYRFIGFKVGDTYHSCLRDLKEFYGVKNLQELETLAKRLDLGFVNAVWKSLLSNSIWESYLWHGSFRVGTTAKRLVLRPLNP